MALAVPLELVVACSTLPSDPYLPVRSSGLQSKNVVKCVAMSALLLTFQCIE